MFYEGHCSLVCLCTCTIYFVTCMYTLYQQCDPVSRAQKSDRSPSGPPSSTPLPRSLRGIWHFSAYLVPVCYVCTTWHTHVQPIYAECPMPMQHFYNFGTVRTHNILHCHSPIALSSENGLQTPSTFKNKNH